MQTRSLTVKKDSASVAPASWSVPMRPRKALSMEYTMNLRAEQTMAE
jgi:hypothetical protein